METGPCGHKTNRHGRPPPRPRAPLVRAAHRRRPTTSALARTPPPRKVRRMGVVSVQGDEHDEHMSERDVAIVLSGGGMNGVLLELGFLKRLRVSSLWPRVGRIYGTSAGALTG